MEVRQQAPLPGALTRNGPASARPSPYRGGGTVSGGPSGRAGKLLVDDPAGAAQAGFADSAWKPVALPRALNKDDAFARDIVDIRPASPGTGSASASRTSSRARMSSSSSRARARPRRYSSTDAASACTRMGARAILSSSFSDDEIRPAKPSGRFGSRPRLQNPAGTGPSRARSFSARHPPAPGRAALLTAGADQQCGFKVRLRFLLQ